VRLILEAQSGLATIEVCDTGTGIPPGEAHRVFDRFRSASQKANRRSYGLGLTLARDVISRHGGRLVLTHTSSRGTSFRVELPGD
jgi:signal transduction histidine kinase